MYTCAKCGGVACGRADHANMPENCPMRESVRIEKTMEEYNKPQNFEFFLTSTAIEALGYCEWPRFREIMEFCLRMNYKKIGLAFCMGLRKESMTIDKVLRNQGFDVVSVICKCNGLSKEQVGLSEDSKVVPGSYEPMCNPIGQAQLLNEQKTSFNIVVGLCVGHDSLFYKYSDALVTTLIAKDRVLAHNPVGAIYNSFYFKNRIKPDKSKI